MPTGEIVARCRSWAMYCVGGGVLSGFLSKNERYADSRSIRAMSMLTTFCSRQGKAQLLRDQKIALLTPPECTFQPRLFSKRPVNR